MGELFDDRIPQIIDQRASCLVHTVVPASDDQDGAGQHAGDGGLARQPGNHQTLLLLFS